VKRKNGKGNRVCRKNEKGTRESRSNIQESSGQDKVTDRSKIKRKRRMEKRDKIMLSTKNLVFKEKPAKKLVDQYISSYIIDKVVSTNVVKLHLSMLMRIHLVVNISYII